MKLRHVFAGMLALSALSAHAAHAGLGWRGNGTPCKETAKEMYRACQFDIRDNRNVAEANCTNIADADDRRDCLEDARATLREDMASCTDQFLARRDACEVLGEYRYDPDPLLDPTNVFVDPDEVGYDYPPNPYVSIVAGHTYVLRAGEDGEETVVVHVTDESREIQGVLCRVIVDAVVVREDDEYVPVEVTDDWVAQTVAGDTYYCGEIARNYDDGVLRDLEGSFEAGRDSAKAGVLIKGHPIKGLAHRQEFALGEAEDIIQYEDLAASPSEENSAFPCNGGCVKTFDFTPLAPESTEFKYYLKNVGFVLAEAMEDGVLTGEREELVCVGDSLDILWEDSCGIAGPDALLAKLCELSPKAFCVDDAE
jgi:hypothetical protein